MPTIAKANSQLIAQSHATQTRKKRLKIIATFDIIEATTLLSISILQLIYISINKLLLFENLDYWQGYTLVGVHGVSTVFMNGVQMWCAWELLKGLNLQRKSLSLCLYSTKLWLRVGVFLFTALLFKGIVFIFITYAIHDNILRVFWCANVLAVVLEVTLRLIGGHYAREFLENLPIIRVFAILVISAYCLRLFENIHSEGPPKGFFRTGEKTPLTIFLWCAAFIVNILQFLVASSLFTIVKEGTTDFEGCINKSRNWLVVANALLVMLLSKLIYFAFFDKNRESVAKVLMLILCIAELFFKGYGMYFVKELFDDLKAAYTAPKNRRGQSINNRKPSQTRQAQPSHRDAVVPLPV